MVLRYDAGGIAQRPERGFGHKNQSLMALANRLLRAIPADAEARDGWRVNLLDLDFAAVNRIILISAAVLGGLYVGVMPSRANRTRGTSAIEAALLILLILMFSPLSFNYFVRLAALPADPGAAPGPGGAEGLGRATGAGGLGGRLAGVAVALAGGVEDGGGLRQLVLRRGDPAGGAGLEARRRAGGRLADPDSAPGSPAGASPGSSAARRPPGRSPVPARHARPDRVASGPSAESLTPARPAFRVIRRAWHRFSI